MDKKAYYKILKTNKTRIIRRYVNTYYGRLAWNVGVLGNIPPRTNPILDELESRKTWGPAQKEVMWGLHLCSAKYFDEPTTAKDVVDCLERFYVNKCPKTFHDLYHATFKGYPPKLSNTLAMQEFLSRGFIHKEDTRGFLKHKHSIVVNSAPLTWPSQFSSQQEGLLFLIKNGINGHCGCPALEQQRNFTNGLR